MQLIVSTSKMSSPAPSILRPSKRPAAARLNDPGSLQIEATKFGLNEDSEEKQYYRVLMKFRAKNGFGGYVLSYAGASCDLKTGEVIDIQID